MRGSPNLSALVGRATKCVGFWGAFRSLPCNDVSQSRTSTTAGERLGSKVLIFPAVSLTAGICT